MNWYAKVFKQYLDFSGRARRREFWMFSLFHYLIVIFLIMIDVQFELESNEIGLLTTIYFLISFLPFLAVSVRRLHDTGKSGWYLLIGLLPFVGGFILFIFLCFESEYGTNKWGQNPLGKGNSDPIDEIGVV